MGIPFFIVFALSIAVLSVGVTGWGDFASISWNQKLRFSLDAQFIANLDEGVVSEEVRQEFGKHEILLSQNATTSAGERSANRWLVVDKDRKRTYSLKREECMLNIYYGSLPHLDLEVNCFAIFRCFSGFVLFLISLYFMGFFLYLEERESGRIMKNVKSFVRLREFLERQAKREAEK